MPLIPLFVIFGLVAMFNFLRRRRRGNTPLSREKLQKLIHQKTPSPRTRNEIYHIAFLLTQKLPVELVKPILDFAELWVAESSKQTFPVTIDENDIHRKSGFRYLSSPRIGSYANHPVRKIVFTIVSQDQGWSDHHLDHGTYRNSWTWFEAAVKDTRYEGEPEHFKPRLVARNVHAGKRWNTQVVTWSVNSKDEDERRWLMDLKRGDVVDLMAWARYPGWQNQMNYAQIDIYTAAIR